MKNIDRFVFPGLLILFGSVLLIWGIRDEQTAWFIWGVTALLLAGIVTLLLQLGMITRQRSVILGIAFLAGSALLSWMNVRSVQGTIEATERNNMIRKNVIQGLKDLRTAQIAYKDNKGGFTDSTMVLTDFVKNGKLLLIKAAGQVPDTLTEQEAVDLEIVTRDSIYINALDSLFLSPYVQEGRSYPFNIDSLHIARFSEGKKFKMQSGVVSSSGRNVPVLLIEEPKPINKEEPLRVGDMDRATTAGNWKDVE